jgi:hypothetical protein
MQQSRLACSRRTEKQNTLTGRNRQVEVVHRPVWAPRMTPAPACRRNGSPADGIWRRTHCAPRLRSPTLPDSNRLSAPVFASPLTTYHDSRPAIRTPEMTAATV